ncbi:MAG: autotransporter-associated beta strand repeat-containing protein, partial [Opitutales bacterium]|nr:autotransporter-associated beta strand repeat-containing protein [Opitutales bacterium]
VTDAASVASDAILNLSGETVALYSAISNEGTVTIANTTTFALDNLTSENNVYTLISGAGTVSGWDTLANTNFTHNSQATIRRLDASYSVLVGSGTLTWAGTVDNVWNTNVTANWTLSGANNSVNFFDGDSVIFATAGANVSLANDVSVGTMTVSQNLTLAGAGTIALSAPGNLIFENASTLALGEGVTLDLGSSNGALDLSKVEGTGTVVYEHTVNGGGSSGLVTSANFTGTIDYTGNLNWADTYNAGQVSIGNDGITLRLSSRDGALDGIWGRYEKTFKNRVEFATNYIIYSGDVGVKFEGDVDATGVALTLSGTNRFEFAGETTIGTLTQNHGTLTVSGTLATNAYTGVNLSGGDDSTVSVSSGASWTNTGDFYLRHTGNGTTAFTIDGNVNVGGTLYISRDGKGTIEINDGGVLDVSTLEFGQYWDGVDNKGSRVNVNAGGTLVLDAISIGGNLNTSELKLNGGTLGTSSAELTIDASTTSGAGAGALPLTLGAGTTSTIHTSVYENNAFGATGADITIVNGISGDGALNVDGAGTLTLSGANTFTGGLSVSAGILNASGKVLGAGTVSVASGAILNLSG